MENIFCEGGANFSVCVYGGLLTVELDQATVREIKQERQPNGLYQEHPNTHSNTTATLAAVKRQLLSPKPGDVAILLE